MNQYDAKNRLQRRSSQTDILLGCINNIGVSQAGLALTHNVLHLVVAVRIPVIFGLYISKDISSGNADGLPHSVGNVPDNLGSCSHRSVRAWKPPSPHEAYSVPTTGISSSHSSDSSGNAVGLPQSGGNVPDSMGSCSSRPIRAWKPLQPHSGGNVPDSMGSCSTRSVRAGKPLVPHNAGSVPLTGKSSSPSPTSSGNAPAAAQDSSKVPAVSCQRCHHHVLNQSSRKQRR